ncbi:hypothetical protein GTP81_10460 [Rugamonas sp. FT107W]|uniref:Uncharacterized protein n=1 Tax=Duganella vulcania TaxID=2692166 RepID=A0A845HJT5_9BURK|nr:hypothetical protein [Duganella vulcania]MYM87742.1 hypothetical protein [Duganella vulcania]MYN17174.1 hypothetical protein [Duganella vulcania]
MSQAQSFDASIPVLTEVLKAEPLGDELLPGEAASGIRTTLSKRAEMAAQLEADAIDNWSDAEWAMMEHRLSERIMHQLQSRVDFVLEQRIKDSMAEVLTHALHGLTNEIRIGLHDTIEKIVARAVSQELTHLQAQKK